MASARGRMPKNKLSVAGPTEAPKPDRDSEARERRYRAEDALRDIERAKKHENDKSLMKDVKQLAKERIKDLGKVCK